MVVSLPAEAKSLPSGEKVRELTQAVCPWRVASERRAVTSHRHTLPSAPPEAKVLPSGANATWETEPACASSREPTCRCAAISQMRMVPSKPAAARRLSFQRAVAAAPGESWNLARSPWAFTFHSQRVPPPSLTRVLPSGAKATEPSWYLLFQFPRSL